MTKTSAIVIGTPYSPFHDFATSLRVDVLNGTLLGIFFSKEEDKIPHIMRRLEGHRKKSLGSPLTILIFLYDEFGSKAEDWRENLDHEVVRIERATGMTSLALVEEAASDAEYERLLGDLHACNTNLIFLSDMIHFELEFGEFCFKFVDIFEDLRKRAGKSTFHTPRTRDEFHQRVMFLLKLSHFRQQQTQALRSRIQSQITLVGVDHLHS